MPAPVQRVRFWFLDRDGNKARLTVYVPVSLSRADIIAFLDYAAERLRGVSDAEISRATLENDYLYPSPSDASETSDVSTFVVAVYSNEDGSEALYVPSPDHAIFTTTGPLAGILADVTNSAVMGLMSFVTDCTFVLVTPESETYPSVYVAGGYVE